LASWAAASPGASAAASVASQMPGFISPYMDASRIASVLTLVMAEAGVAVLYPAYSARHLCLAALMVSVIDTSSPQRARSSRKDTGSSRSRGTRFCHHSVKSLAQPFDDPPSVKWLIGYAACAP
jgi:hypothetical protein